MLKVYGVRTSHAMGHKAAYALLEHAFQSFYARPMPPVARTERGKPYFLHCNVEFSLSHTKTMAFCVLSNQTVGIDAETIRPIRHGVPARTLNKLELSWMERQPDLDRAFLRLWTMKEAWVKCTGHGLNGQPKNIVLENLENMPSVAGQQAYFQTRELENVLVTVCSQQRFAAEWVLWEKLL